LFDVLEKQRANLLFNVVLFVTRAVSLIVGGVLGDPLLAIALFGLSGAVLWFAHTIWMLQLGGVPVRRALDPLLRYGSIAAPLVVLLWLAVRSTDATALVSLASAGLAGLYYLAVWILDIRRRGATP
jgi:hypothetical protein